MKYAKEVKLFKGLKNDENDKNVPFEYFFRMQNFNFPTKGKYGVDVILNPTQERQLSNYAIDGLYEYRFLDENNILCNEQIGVSNGVIYKNPLSSSPTVLKSGLETGKCIFAVSNDKLFIFNGKNYPQVYVGNKGVVKEMGAPSAELVDVLGTLTGTYYWALTYVTSGGEEVLGSVSNTLNVGTQKQALLTLPLGYTGVTSRKLYRTANGGTQLKLVATIADNTTLTYTDSIADTSLGANIPDINNELPKPYSGLSANSKLYGAVVDKYPTQVFISETNKELFDVAEGFTDISNYGDDNTPVKGIGFDFNKVIVGSERNIAFINSDNSVTFTRAYVGMKDAYTPVNVPSFGDFPGGLMFVSSANDVRVMNGLQALPVATSLDNVTTENWAQDIRGSLSVDLKSNPNMHAIYFDYKYHLLVGYTKYVFDIKNLGWTFHKILTDSYQSKPNVLAVLIAGTQSKLFNGQINGWIEQEYASIKYRGEDVEAFVESAQIEVSKDWKFVEALIFWVLPSKNNNVTVEVITDNNDSFKITGTFNLKGGVFNKLFFNSNYFLTDTVGLDYRRLNINRNTRWFKYRLTVHSGSISYQGFGLLSEQLQNNES